MSLPDTLIVAEGDSWFQLIKWNAIPAHLKSMDRGRYELHNIAFPGDNFMDYAQKRVYLDTLKGWEGNRIIKHRFLILSGGGNDLMKDHFDEYLDPDSDTFLNETFDIKMSQIEITYKLIFHLMKQHFPEVIVLVHGYDHVIPRENGAHLGEKMKGKNIDPNRYGRAIMERVIDRFNDNLLIPLINQYPNVEHVDLRGFCEEKKDNWGDEIHPDSATFKKMAREFHKKIQAHMS